MRGALTYSPFTPHLLAPMGKAKIRQSVMDQLTFLDFNSEFSPYTIMASSQNNSCHAQRVLVSQIIIIWSWLHLLKKIVSSAYYMSDTAKKSASVSCINIWYKGIKLAQCFFGQNKKILSSLEGISVFPPFFPPCFFLCFFSEGFSKHRWPKTVIFKKKKNWIWRSSISSTMKKINLITKVLWGPCYNAVSLILKNIYVLFYGLKNVFTYILAFKLAELCKADIISLLQMRKLMFHALKCVNLYCYQW